MGFGDAMKKMIGIEDDEDIEITEEEIEAEKEKLNKSEAKQSESHKKEGSRFKPEHSYERVAPLISKPAGRSVSMNGSAPFKMLVIEPKSFDECTKLVDNLKARKPIIINLEKVDMDIARKMFDFLSGAAYALNGNVQQVTPNIFIFAPMNVDIAAKLNRGDTQTGPAAPGNQSPWR